MVLADQEREASIEHARQNVAELERSLDDARDANLSLADALTTLRSAIAAQEELLVDTEGFLE